MAEALPTTLRRTRDCLECGKKNVAWAAVCALCARPLRHVATPVEPAVSVPVSAARVLHAASRAPSPYVVVAIGAALAPVFGLTPILQYMGWFLTSLVHEMGHCVAAWLFGSPAYPAIRIDGHAAAIHVNRVERLIQGPQREAKVNLANVNELFFFLLCGIRQAHAIEFEPRLKPAHIDRINAQAFSQGPQTPGDNVPNRSREVATLLDDQEP
jgi:hypothetical protein